MYFAENVDRYLNWYGIEQCLEVGSRECANLILMLIESRCSYNILKYLAGGGGG